MESIRGTRDLAKNQRRWRALREILNVAARHVHLADGVAGAATPSALPTAIARSEVNGTRGKAPPKNPGSNQGRGGDRSEGTGHEGRDQVGARGRKGPVQSNRSADRVGRR